MPFTIRHAQPKDLSNLVGLMFEIDMFYGDKPEPLGVRHAQINAALFGAEPRAKALLVEDGSLVGVAIYSYLWPARGTTSSLYLKELFVTATRRGQGAGTVLMKGLLQVAAQTNCSRVEWTVLADSAQAQRFYQSLGVTPATGKLLYRIDLQ